MTGHHTRRLPWTAAPFALLASGALLAGCAGDAPVQEAIASGAVDAMPDPSGEVVAEATPEAGHSSAGLPSAHVHGVAVNPADDLVYLATHDGLFRYGDSGPERVGPVIDLMGFTVAGPDRFYASGHPGPGTDLPQPVGLIESVDGGATWSELSRQGESDFHALTATDSGVVGFDGTLRRSDDGLSWTALPAPVAPYALTAAPDGSTLLATTQAGPLRSTDEGVTWQEIGQAPLLQVVDWAAEETVVGVTPDGTVEVSDDSGATWTTRGDVEAAPQAVGADIAPDGLLRVLVVTTEKLLSSTDGGSTFVPFTGS